MKETLKARISAEAFAKTEAKIDGCFASGHGTVLYFEDTSVVKKLQEAFPSYKDNFPTWSQHTSAMHQFAIWTMLEDMGLGASLQHYNPLIDDEVRRTWNLPDDWMMIAQMPFGTPTGEPGEKEFEDLSKRIKIFSDTEAFSAWNCYLCRKPVTRSRYDTYFLDRLHGSR